MARKVLKNDVANVSWGGSTVSFRKGEVVECTASMITAIGAGNLRDATGVIADAASPSRDQMGEQIGVSNATA